MIGNKGNYFFEGNLNEFGHFVLAKKVPVTEYINISGLHTFQETMTFPNNEIFTTQEAIEILIYFHENKAIPLGFDLVGKRYLL